MKNRQTIIKVLVVAMALGTAWAIRGKFGHEQGAAWAGAIGAIALILVAGRTDWYHKVFKLALAAAVGWGLGGMISYGVVVGYGRAADFPNVYYGLTMLFVIGALYGFLGGGLFSLAIVDRKEFNVKWHALITEMLALGLLAYALLINQIEWFMTPPRSELWAACLGAAIAVAWFMIRNNQKEALRVSVYSGMGAGFGFAFGNFLQVIGAGSSLPFNFWNIMEYAIGFFGGLGMAYSTLTTKWPESGTEGSKHSNLLPMFLVTAFIPFVVWDQSFNVEKLEYVLSIGGSEDAIGVFRVISLLSIALLVLISFTKYYRAKYDYKDVRSIFLWLIVVYAFLSFLLTGIYKHPIEQYLYILNIAAILFLMRGQKVTFDHVEEFPRKWLIIILIIICLLALLAVIAVSSHGPLKGSQMRFL